MSRTTRLLCLACLIVACGSAATETRSESASTESPVRFVPVERVRGFVEDPDPACPGRHFDVAFEAPGDEELGAARFELRRVELEASGGLDVPSCVRIGARAASVPFGETASFEVPVATDRMLRARINGAVHLVTLTAGDTFAIVDNPCSSWAFAGPRIDPCYASGRSDPACAAPNHVAISHGSRADRSRLPRCPRPADTDYALDLTLGGACIGVEPRAYCVAPALRTDHEVVRLVADPSEAWTLWVADDGSIHGSRP